jgi:C4-dicarboxylate-specific signal transduction histidine kinase
VKAVLQSEDRHFYEHSGVDWKAVGAAAVGRLFRSKTRGASTVSMQLAVMLQAGGAPKGRKTLSQKWDQMTAARALARSAQHILRTPGGDVSRAEGNLTALLAHIDHAGAVVGRMREFIRRGRPHVSTIDTRNMLQEALTLAFVEASAKHVRIELDAPDDLPAIHGDQVQLEQVVLNLVHNAVEAIAAAGRPEGHVGVAARRLAAPARIEISVLDNGPGVEGQLADRLFDPLATSKQDGLGLGLSISASILEAHGGRVWLHSREAGATEFRFSLPLDQAGLP